ncbi:hypothetical protein GY45DRAFT_1260579 [Cubamyces sp. BRFM 1775]|nr:hypothetical protein GY45DRAFT_1260579 [Cubamyces sp. BRFM 1775]
MSSSETVTAAETIIADRSFFRIDDSAQFAQSALIFHEYLITLDSEFRLIWGRRATGANVLFFLNRYIMVFYIVVVLASYPAVTDRVRLRWMAVILDIIPYFIWNAFSTMRVYAISGRDWRIASVVCFLMIGPIIGNVYNIPFEKPDNMPPPYNCQFDNSLTIRVHSIIPLIAADTIVLIVTWWKTYRLKKAADEAHIKMSIVDLLLRDGTPPASKSHNLVLKGLGNSAMLVLNVLHIVINYVVEVSFLGDIISIVTSILVSRFIMNLRDLDGKGVGRNTRSVTSDLALGSWHATRQGGTLVFASGGFFDSMGGPLEHSTALAHSNFDGDSEIEGGVDMEGDIHRSGSSEDAVCSRDEKAQVR